MIPTIERITDYLSQYGWSYEQVDEQLLVSGFIGHNRDFQIFIQYAEPWLLIAITRFVPQPTPECRGRFLTEALRLNYEMSLTKLGVDPDEDVTLMVELPAAALNYEQFALALDTLTFWAEHAYLPLLNLARDPNYNFNGTWGIEDHA